MSTHPQDLPDLPGQAQTLLISEGLSTLSRQTSKVNIQFLKIQVVKGKVINKTQIKKPPVTTFVLRKTQLLMNLSRLMMKLKSKFVNLQTIWGSYPYPGRVETICLYPQSLEYMENRLTDIDKH